MAHQIGLYIIRYNSGHSLAIHYTVLYYMYRVTCMGNHTPTSSVDLRTECPSISTSGSIADHEPQDDHNTHEPENSFSTNSTSDNNSSSSSESSDDESGNEQSDATTQPFVGLCINNSGGTNANDTWVILHPAVSSGELNLVQALKQEQYLTDKKSTFYCNTALCPTLDIAYQTVLLVALYNISSISYIIPRQKNSERITFCNS